MNFLLNYLSRKKKDSQLVYSHLPSDYTLHYTLTSFFLVFIIPYLFTSQFHSLIIINM